MIKWEVSKMAAIHKRQLRRNEIGRILIRATNWIGDAVMTLPAVEAVKENFPCSDITILAKPWVAPIYEGLPAVSRVMTYEKRGGIVGSTHGVLKSCGMIRCARFDVAILFQNAFEAALIAFLGGVPIRVGYKTDGRGLLLTHGVLPRSAQKSQHQVEYYLDLLRYMGWTAKSSDPLIRVPEAAYSGMCRLMVEKGIQGDTFLMGLAPGAAYGKSKRWPARRFAEVGDKAAKEWGARIVIFGSEGEKEICDEIVRSMEGEPLNLCGKTSLSEAIALINQCKMFLSNDSGLMHVAAALNVPTLAVFGSTDPMATGPRGLKSVIVRNSVECAPCLKPECDMDYKCLLGVTSEQVWEEMGRLWKRIQ